MWPQYEYELQYLGAVGISARCLDSIRRLLQFGDRITDATLLSCNGRHAVILRLQSEECIAIRSGFTSGYFGEGPRVLSEALALLDSHGCEIDEIDVPNGLLDRLNESRLRKGDLEVIQRSQPRRPIRWRDYVHQEHRIAGERYRLRQAFPPVIPFAIIDGRIQDVGRELLASPDNALLTAFRRFEDTVRRRIASEKHGDSLFKQAFMGTGAVLVWRSISQGEADARAGLFTNAYSAYRNPRAHREQVLTTEQALTEFLLLNHLFLLEAATVNRTGAAPIG